MTVAPRAGFEAPIAVLDALNPALVVLSTVGLVLEFTPLKGWVHTANQVIDLLFVLDLATRLVCLPTGRYLVRGWGALDALACLPALLVVLPPAFALGGVSLLRVLRVLRPLRRLGGEAPGVGGAVFRLGAALVVVSVIGGLALDTLGLAALADQKAAPYHLLYRTGTPTSELAATHTEVLAYASAGRVFDQKNAPSTAKAYHQALDDPLHLRLEVAFRPDSLTTAEGLRLPFEGLVIDAVDVERAHDALVLVLLATLFALVLGVGLALAQTAPNGAKTLRQDEPGDQAELPADFTAEIQRLEARLERIETLAEAKDERLLSQRQLLTIIRETTRETIAALRKKD